ncbi:MAG: serine/threonine protein kinase, partial [Merismopedia sp. SIO2A8]|nr:serine/threonine protein kinase [Merismopedia sp. SIO2A8]
MLKIGNYHLHTSIYEGTASIVYRGIRQLDQQSIIFKLLKQDTPTTQERTRYRQEYDITCTLNQNSRLGGIIQAYALEEWQDRLAIVLEDFGGISLRQAMQSALGQVTPFTIADFLAIALQITNILGEIHASNIIHKDINPSNILIHPQTKQIKLIDFGISTVLSRENPTLKNPNVLEGTLAYLSPEQTGRMNRALDYRTDFYSLGVTFYELLT